MWMCNKFQNKQTSRRSGAPLALASNGSRQGEVKWVNKNEECPLIDIIRCALRTYTHTHTQTDNMAGSRNGIENGFPFSISVAAIFHLRCQLELRPRLQDICHTSCAFPIPSYMAATQCTHSLISIPFEYQNVWHVYDNRSTYYNKIYHES